jgi:hypothetical protein
MTDKELKIDIIKAFAMMTEQDIDEEFIKKAEKKIIGYFTVLKEDGTGIEHIQITDEIGEVEYEKSM